jgi:hypothetical protein
MNLVVLALVIVINGNVFMTARGGHEKPETFASVQECEKQIKQDEVDLAPELKKKPEIQQWFLTCMTRDSYLAAIKR